MNERECELQAAASKVGVGGYRRHVFLCIGPSCCSSDAGLAAWEALKTEIKEGGLGFGPNACYRSKVGCLRICCHGPTAVVYPEGTWYSGMTADRVPRLVKEHLEGGQPIREWIFAQNPLSAPPGPITPNASG
jgi:(2Fe-2S) ferredoxin